MKGETEREKAEGGPCGGRREGGRQQQTKPLFKTKAGTGNEVARWL